MKEPRYHWQYGRLSGYDWCCIGWFYLRVWFYVKTGLVYLRIKYLGELKPGLGYVTCPVHSVLYKLGWFKPSRYTCRTCGNEQYNVLECTVKEDHDGWVKARMESFYKRAEEENPRIIFKFGGEMGRTIRKRRGERQ